MYFTFKLVAIVGSQATSQNSKQEVMANLKKAIEAYERDLPVSTANPTDVSSAAKRHHWSETAATRKPPIKLEADDATTGEKIDQLTGIQTHLSLIFDLVRRIPETSPLKALAQNFEALAIAFGNASAGIIDITTLKAVDTKIKTDPAFEKIEKEYAQVSGAVDEIKLNTNLSGQARKDHQILGNNRLFASLGIENLHTLLTGLLAQHAKPASPEPEQRQALELTPDFAGIPIDLQSPYRALLSTIFGVDTIREKQLAESHHLSDNTIELLNLASRLTARTDQPVSQIPNMKILHPMLAACDEVRNTAEFVAEALRNIAQAITERVARSFHMSNDTSDA